MELLQRALPGDDFATPGEGGFLLLKLVRKLHSEVNVSLELYLFKNRTILDFGVGTKRTWLLKKLALRAVGS